MLSSIKLPIELIQKLIWEYNYLTETPVTESPLVKSPVEVSLVIKSYAEIIKATYGKEPRPDRGKFPEEVIVAVKEMIRLTTDDRPLREAHVYQGAENPTPYDHKVDPNLGLLPFELDPSADRIDDIIELAQQVHDAAVIERELGILKPYLGKTYCFDGWYSGEITYARIDSIRVTRFGEFVFDGAIIDITDYGQDVSMVEAGNHRFSDLPSGGHHYGAKTAEELKIWLGHFKEVEKDEMMTGIQRYLGEGIAKLFG